MHHRTTNGSGSYQSLIFRHWTFWLSTPHLLRNNWTTNGFLDFLLNSLVPTSWGQKFLRAMIGPVFMTWVHRISIMDSFCVYPCASQSRACEGFMTTHLRTHPNSGPPSYWQYRPPFSPFLDFTMPHFPHTCSSCQPLTYDRRDFDDGWKSIFRQPMRDSWMIRLSTGRTDPLRG